MGGMEEVGKWDSELLTVSGSVLLLKLDGDL